MISVRLEIDDIRRAVSAAESIEVVGTGGQKSVFKCEVKGEKLILKFIQVGGVDDNGDAQADIAALKRATRELQTNDALASRFIPALGSIEAGEYEKDKNRFFFYSEEYIPGQTVYELIQKGPLETASLVKLAGDITNALNALWTHTHQVHRDVKPRNVIWRDDSNDFVLIDAGIALALEETSITPTGFIVGTLRYCSPEQIQGRKRALDIRSDLYSLGVMLYEAATGKHPYCTPGQSDAEIINQILRGKAAPLEVARPDLPTEFVQLVNRLLAKQPYLRHKSADDVLSSLTAMGYI